MAFTYTDTLLTDRDRVRFYLQDTVSGSGPKPSSGNFTDAEITGLLTLEGSWQKAVAAGFEALSAAWAIYVDTSVGPRSESLSRIADAYAKQAKKWRDAYGATTGSATSSFVTRVDGYSDDIDAGEV